jgi:hypothetical protein
MIKRRVSYFLSKKMHFLYPYTIEKPIVFDFMLHEVYLFPKIFISNEGGEVI